MKQVHQVAGAIPFFIAVFLNAFVDLGHKIVIQNTVFKLYDGNEQILLTAIVNAMMLLPFILLLSPAGFLSDVMRKTWVMRAMAWFALILTLLITSFYYLGWFWAAFGMTLLLAAQAAIYSPAKFGYIRELFGKESLAPANGAVGALSMIAILSGIAVFSIFFEMSYPTGSDSEKEVLQAIAPLGWLLVLSALVEVVMIYRLPEQAAPENRARFSTKAYLTGKLFAEDMAPVMRRRVIRLSVVGLAIFWGVGQVMLAAFPAFIKEELHMDNAMIVQGILACSGIGIALGSIIAGRFSRNYIETGLLPLGALGFALGLLCLPHLHSYTAFVLAFLFIGFSGGVFTVPLNAMIQFHADEHELGRTLAANNWVQNVVMLLFLGVTVGFSYVGFSSKTLLEIIAVITLIGCCYTLYELPQSLVRFVFSRIVSQRYRVLVQGMKNIPAKGGVLLLGNHVSWIDWAVLQLASPRPVRFVMLRAIYQRWYLKWFFDLFGCIPIESGAQSRNALDTVAASLNNGDVVCLFPEGAISRTGHLGEFRRGYERACEKTNGDVVIVPFYLRGLWGSQFSRSSAYLKNKNRPLLKRDLIVAFGKPLPKETKADILKRRVLDLSIDSWQEYVNGLDTIGRCWIDAAKKMGNQLAIVDTMGTELSAHRALAGASAIASRIAKLPDPNIGVLLPTSAAGVLTNLAVILTGKTLINLNYTASQSAFASALAQANIKTVFTSARFLKKLEDKGIPANSLLQGVNVIAMEDFAGSIPTTEKITRLLLVKLLPAFVLKALWTCKQKSDDIAVILFSSGSEGIPKGVQISHKNIIANVKQITDVLNVEEKDVVMANLPLFHAFGLTVTQFMPLLEAVPMVCHADPTDALGSAKAIAQNRVTVLFGTSTFLRLYCRNHKIHPLMLDSLRLVVAGAEKLQEEVRTAFNLKFNLPIYEGYGATETTPVASVNLPDKIDPHYWQIQVGNRPGSVGMPLPGSSCMIVDPVSFKELPTGEAGMILIGGAQVMVGYLNNPEKTASAIKELQGMRWYVTGDKGVIDADGFLFIQDRYSRFAKIGGEMVSLTLVESALKKAINNDAIDVIVVAIDDAKKGERLIAITNAAIAKDELRSEVLKQGLNALAIPGEWMQVDAMPLLGSGKTDFSLAKKMAKEWSEASSATVVEASD